LDESEPITKLQPMTFIEGRRMIQLRAASCSAAPPVEFAHVERILSSVATSLVAHYVVIQEDVMLRALDTTMTKTDFFEGKCRSCILTIRIQQLPVPFPLYPSRRWVLVRNDGTIEMVENIRGSIYQLARFLDLTRPLVPAT
jgi:hypothetical protein